MNRELELKLQAYVDGELSDREARGMEAWFEKDPEAQALLAELQMTKKALAGNEPAMGVPESREFYWSKIEREIVRSETQAAQPSIWEYLRTLRRYLAPIAGTALILFLAYGAFINKASEWPLAEVENLSEETGSVSFRSHSENMFVVWVYDKSTSPDIVLEPDEDDVFVQ